MNNPPQNTAREPRKTHRFLRTRHFENVSGPLGAALCASTLHFMCMLEDAAQSNDVTFEVRVTKFLESHSEYPFKVGHVEDGNLVVCHSATDGRNWWRFFYGVRIIAGKVPLEQVKENLIARSREVLHGAPRASSLGLAFQAVSGLPDPIPGIFARFEEAPKPLAAPAKKPPKAKKAPTLKSGPAASKPPKEIPAKPPPKKAPASGPLPIDIEDAGLWSLVLEACRAKGLSAGVWMGEAARNQAVTLAIVDLEPKYDVAEVPEGWVSVIVNRLMMRDLLHEQAHGGQTYFQLVLSGEKPSKFAAPEPEAADTEESSAEQVSADVERQPEIDEPEPPEEPAQGPDDGSEEEEAGPPVLSEGPTDPPSSTVPAAGAPAREELMRSLAEQAKIHRQIAQLHGELAAEVEKTAALIKDVASP